MSTEEKNKTKPKTGLETKYDYRQHDMWELYTDPRSPTRGNAKQSAIKAGYTEESACNIYTQNWFKSKLKIFTEMLPRAEEVILEDLNMDTQVEMIGKDDNGRPAIVLGVDNKLRKIRSDTAQFVAETIGNRRYHKKFDVEANININLIEDNDAISKLFRKDK